MIKNLTIKALLEEKTKNDKAMRDFLFDIVNHENESCQYSKKYKELIDLALNERGNE
ncbi:hypothetical protein JR334_06610 [Clostridia bacterium]|nr:hypothetical protein JR334_06610 [Clostridia bacterium]